MTMNRWRKLAAPAVAIAAGLVVTIATTPASADFIFDITTGNSALSGFSGPYAQVDVHLNSSTMATITFTSLTNGGNIYLFGASSAVDVNVNGMFTLGTITGANSGTGFTPGPYSNGGSGNVSTFGTFNLTINSFDGFTHSSDTISFTINDTSGTWANATNVLIANADGNAAAAHIFVTSSPANAMNGALVTGFASGSSCIPGTPGCFSGPPPQVPEPGSLAIMGFGLAALGALLGRRGKTTGLWGRGAA